MIRNLASLIFTSAFSVLLSIYRLRPSLRHPIALTFTLDPYLFPKHHNFLIYFPSPSSIPARIEHKPTLTRIFILLQCRLIQLMTRNTLGLHNLPDNILLLLHRNLQLAIHLLNAPNFPNTLLLALQLGTVVPMPSLMPSLYRPDQSLPYP